MNNLQRLQAELAEHNRQILEIESRYPDGDFSGESAEADYKSLQEITKSVEQKSLDLNELITRSNALSGASNGARQYLNGSASLPLPGQGAPTDRAPERKSFGQLFVESEQYQHALSSGAFNSSMRASVEPPKWEGTSYLEQKAAGALIYTGRTGFGPEADEPFPSITRRAGYLPLLYAERTFTDLFPRTSISEEILEFVREKTFNNNAEMIAEATAVAGTSGIKPQSDFDFEVDNTTVKDIAHWMAVTNKQLRQSNIRSLIDDRLSLGLDIKIEEQLVSGDGTGNNLLGILEAGIQTFVQGSNSIFDMIHKMMTAVRVTGLGRVNFIAMNPVDWEKVRLARENAATGTLGGYLFGGPGIAGVPQLWGIPVTQTLSLSEGTVLVGDSNQAQILDRQRTGVRTGTIDQMFIRNLQVLLMEAALAFVVYRPASFVVATGVS